MATSTGSESVTLTDKHQGEEPETVRVGLLGGFRVSVGTRTIGESEWKLRKAGSLLKLLALAPDHRMHRERVMDLLWQGLGAKAAANNLRQVLYTARRALEPTPTAASRYLNLRDEQLALCPGRHLWVDVEAFEDAAATARRVREPAAYRAALELYAGDLLLGDLYEEWAEGRREELRQKFLSLLVELASLYEERGDFGPAIEALRRVVTEEPLREEAHLGLMRLHALSGGRREALKQYDRLKKSLARELAAEPDPISRHLYEEIHAGRFPLPTDSHPEKPPDAGLHNLPAARTSFIGREHELVEVKRELAMTRLLTLTGAGGSGKTRLALEVGKDLVGAYPDGVWLVELAPLSEGELVPQSVATVLGVRERPAQSLTDALAEHLRTKDLLLVLDNCEHLVDDVALLIEALLDSCPRLRVLTTSREVLSIPGEVSRPVPLLSLPEVGRPLTVEALESCSSARLFVERASCKSSAFFLTPKNAKAVAEICLRLDGIPLAIELTATRVGALSVKQISNRLGDSLKLLTGGGRATAPRHQTLKGALDWSYDLLSRPERKLFGRLSVFAGGWTLEAAESVGAGDDIEEEDVLDLISNLVDKSLVEVQEDRDGAIRYRMLEPVRQYAQARLQGSGEAEPVQCRHAAFFLALAEEAEPELRGARQATWLDRLEREHDNLRASLSYSLEREEVGLGLRLGGALGRFWYIRGYLSEGRRWLDAALDKEGSFPASARARALARTGWLACEQGDYESSAARSKESLALSRKVGDVPGIATALSILGWTALFQNELERASELTEESVTLHRESGDTALVARAVVILGLVAVARRDHERAEALGRENLMLSREAGDNLAIVLSLSICAFAFLGQGDHRRAREFCKEGVELSRRLQVKDLTVGYLHILASLAGVQGEPVRSARLWGATEVMREAIDTVLSPLEHHIYEPYITAARSRLDEAAWDAAWAEGRAMEPEEAVEYALSGEKPASAPEEPSEGRQSAALTPRQQEIAAMVAQGMTNRQIAAGLVISEGTVANHVAKVLHKLDLHSRAQVAARMVEEQPLALNPE